jgi:carbon storage regulator
LSAHFKEEEMLILSRKLGECIAIDGDIKLQVLEVSGNRVRLGICAPDDCRIFRAEREFAEPAQEARRRKAALTRSGI